MKKRLPTRKNVAPQRLKVRIHARPPGEQTEPTEKPQTRAKKETVIEGFQKLWSDLMTSPVHLDSLLSKQSPRLKSILAQIVPSILLRPSSQAEALGVGVASEEPWSLTAAQRAGWRPAVLMAGRMYELMVSGKAKVFENLGDFPPAMAEAWERDFGPAVRDELVRVLSQEPPLGIRVVRKWSPEQLLKEMNSDSKLPVKAEVSKISPIGVQLSSYAPILNTELYEKGAFEIQDEGSQIMALFSIWPEKFAKLLKKAPSQLTTGIPYQEFKNLPQPPAWTVVDACAGAGGKTLALSDLLQGKGRVFSYDTSEKKLQALRRRVSRAQLTNVQAVALKEGQETEVIKKFRRRANVVLVDAPCSGWGVLRRNPDIKWRQSQEVLLKMPLVQKRLLSLYADLVAPGGRLVFGVCTFRREETTDLVSEFLKSHPDFAAGPGGYLGPGPCDGFFMQAFERKA